MTLVGLPAAADRSRSERMRAPVLTVAGLAAATVALHVRDPHVQHSWGVCPLYALTGIYCPGCGGLRGVNDLTDGHPLQAASSNFLLVLALPLAGILVARWVTLSWQGRGATVVPPLPRAVKLGLLLVVVAFTLMRNVPGSWLAP